MKMIHFDNYVAELENISIGGLANTGKTCLAMKIAEDLIREYNMKLIVVTDTKSELWYNFSRCMNCDTIIHESSDDNHMWVLKEICNCELSRPNNLVIHDCRRSARLDPNAMATLREWQARCKEIGNYLVVVHWNSMVLETAGIRLTVYMTEDFARHYTHFIKSTKESASHDLVPPSMWNSIH